jgi:uncharacterized protein YbaR (Trm112 family)
MIDEAFLAILACPICGNRPALRQEENILVCTAAGHRFPVKNGIPHLLPEDEVQNSTPLPPSSVSRDQSLAQVEVSRSEKTDEGGGGAR